MDAEDLKGIEPELIALVKLAKQIGARVHIVIMSADDKGIGLIGSSVQLERTIDKKTHTAEHIDTRTAIRMVIRMAANEIRDAAKRASMDLKALTSIVDGIDVSTDEDNGPPF